MRKPLTELLKDNVERTCMDGCHQQAKEKIKDALFNTPVLQYFDLGILRQPGFRVKPVITHQASSGHHHHYN